MENPIPVRKKIQYVLTGMAVTFCAATLNSAIVGSVGTGGLFFLVPLSVGGIGGYLIGAMKFRLEQKLEIIKHTLQEVELYKDAVNQAGVDYP